MLFGAVHEMVYEPIEFRRFKSDSGRYDDGGHPGCRSNTSTTGGGVGGVAVQFALTRYPADRVDSIHGPPPAT